MVLQLNVCNPVLTPELPVPEVPKNYIYRNKILSSRLAEDCESRPTAKQQIIQVAASYSISVRTKPKRPLSIEPNPSLRLPDIH